MRIAVVGGTGLVGRHVIELLPRAGHEVVVIARSHGVDVTTGEGLAQALDEADAVVDVTNAGDPAVAREFFGTATERLLAAERRAGVRHHVVLSIVGVDRVETNGHDAGKRRQEELVEAGPVPSTILRATQFHDFAGMVVGWTRKRGVATVPPLLVQPVAVTDVAEVLTEIATGAPQGRAPELAGPEPQDLVDMARRPRRGSSGSPRVGTMVPSASRWPETFCCRDTTPGSRRRPSTPGSPQHGARDPSVGRIKERSSAQQD